MSRKIKFRAWQEKGKEMLYEINPTATWAIWADLNEDIIAGIQEEYTLMQYTGLKDKNGKEIYEGDIVLIPDTHTEKVDVGVGSVPVAQEPDPHFSEVVFENGQFLFSIRETKDTYWKGNYSYLGILEESEGEIEVIGNIYENPELLEK